MEIDAAVPLAFARKAICELHSFLEAQGLVESEISFAVTQANEVGAWVEVSGLRATPTNLIITGQWSSDVQVDIVLWLQSEKGAALQITNWVGLWEAEPTSLSGRNFGVTNVA